MHFLCNHRRLTLTIWIICIILHGTFVFSFNHEVVAGCLPEKKICEFQLHIAQRRNMAVYGRPGDSKLARDNARLLQVKDGALFITNNSHCGELTKATETEIRDSLTADGVEGFVYTINGQYPGPTLTVYEGQEVAVKVINLLYQESVTIHWHGMRQNKTNWMDGVPTVTQCPIAPQDSFMYRFIAFPSGTHWYHSHQGAQRSDGIYGALVVLPKPPKSIKEEKKFQDNNRARDYVVLVQDKYPENSKVEFHNFYNGISQGTTNCYKPAVQVDGTTIGPIEYYSALINGRGYPLSTQIVGLPLERFAVRFGLSYRFRLINPGLLYTFKFSIDQHKLRVVASDGYDLVPTKADSLYVTPGERYDVIIEANQPLGSYWMRLETLHWDLSAQKPIPQSVVAVLDYTDQQTPTSTIQICTKDQPCVHVNCPFTEFPADQYISCIHIEDLQSKHDTHITRTMNTQVFLNFHYANSTDGGIRSAINGIQHLPSSVSTSSQSIRFEHKCDHSQCADGRPCRCTNQLELPTHSVVHMVFFTQMWKYGSALIGSSHPVHMHGHHFEVIKVGYPDIDPVTKIYQAMSSDIVCNNDACNSATWRNINRSSVSSESLNLVNPPLKDTVHVPAGGYVVVRYMTDNPGFWMLHCHIENHNLEGMALIVKEGDFKEMDPPPPNFPKCGSFHLSEKDFRNSLERRDTSHGQINPLFLWIPVVSGILIITNIINAVVVYKCTTKKKRSSRQHILRPVINTGNSIFSSYSHLDLPECDSEPGSRNSRRCSVDSGSTYSFLDSDMQDAPEGRSPRHRSEATETTALL